MATIIDDYSPIYVGDTGAPFSPTFQHADGTAVNLTGATITMEMVNDDTGAVINCAGTWTIDSAPNGEAHYQYQSADVATAGLWKLYVTITVGGEPVHADMKKLQILPVR
jgi:hypothetical protein